MRLNIVLFLSLFFTLSACDLISNVQPEERSSALPTLKMHPIPFPDNATPSNPAGPFPFTMNYSTLAHTDNERPYQYFRYRLEFPPEVLREADGKTRRIRFRIAFQSQNAREDAGRTEQGHVSFRFVNAIIPDSETAEMMVKYQTSFFRPGSHLHQVLLLKGAIEEDAMDLPVRMDAITDV